MKCVFIHRTIHKVCSNNSVVLLLFSSHLCTSFFFLQSTRPPLPLCVNTHTFVSSGQSSDYNTFLQTHTYTHKRTRIHRDTHTHTETNAHAYVYLNSIPIQSFLGEKSENFGSSILIQLRKSRRVKNYLL